MHYARLTAGGVKPQQKNRLVQFAVLSRKDTARKDASACGRLVAVAPVRSAPLLGRTPAQRRHAVIKVSASPLDTASEVNKAIAVKTAIAAPVAYF